MSGAKSASVACLRVIVEFHANPSALSTLADLIGVGNKDVTTGPGPLSTMDAHNFNERLWRYSNNLVLWWRRVDLSAEDFVDKLWLLSITLLLIMVSGENLLERGRLEKKRKPKSGNGVLSGHRISWIGFINRRSRAKMQPQRIDPTAPLASRSHQVPAARTSSFIEKDYLDPAIQGGRD